MATGGWLVIIVSGCPRSGTSLMMKIMVEALGKDRILGEEFPQKLKDTAAQEPRSEIAQYLIDKIDKANKPQQARATDMNPGGFYEMNFCTRGIFYTPHMEDKLEELLHEEKPTVCKIVSQGLAQSDPRFIDKIIFMARDPRAVAKSQERLGRNDPMSPEDAPELNGQKQLVRSVAMYNGVTMQAAAWIKKHPGIDVMVVNYDTLIDDPGQVMARLESFLEEGDFMAATRVIDQGLRRSHPSAEDVNDGLDLAMQIHGHLLTGDWQAILDAVEEERKKPREINNWMCVRLNRMTTRAACEFCFNEHEPTVKNYIKHAKGNWRLEPCAYECGIGGDTGAISVAESIKNNHWISFALLYDLEDKQPSGCCK